MDNLRDIPAQLREMADQAERLIETFDQTFSALKDFVRPGDAPTAPAAPARRPLKTEVEPTEFPLLDAGDWLDADGTIFDPELHAWSKDLDRPSVTAAGKFRAKRKGSAPPAPRSGDSKAPVGTALDPAAIAKAAPMPPYTRSRLPASANTTGALNVNNFRDIPAQLREMADQAERLIETFDQTFSALKDFVRPGDAPTAPAAPAAAARRPLKTDIEPTEFPLLDAGDWRDADGTIFDPELHAWSKDLDRPSVTAAGKFRARRKGAAPPVPRSGDSKAPVGTALDAAAIAKNAAERETAGGGFEDILDSYLADIETADGASLIEIEKALTRVEMSADEKTEMAAAIADRRAILADVGPAA